MWHIKSTPNLNYTICKVDVLPIGWFGYETLLSFLLINSISTSRQARSQHLPRRDDGSMASCVRSRGNHHPTTTNFGSLFIWKLKLVGVKSFWICLICLIHPNFHPELFDESSCYDPSLFFMPHLPFSRAPSRLERSILVVLVQKKGCRRPKATRHLFLFDGKNSKEVYIVKIRANRSMHTATKRNRICI